MGLRKVRAKEREKKYGGLPIGKENGKKGWRTIGRKEREKGGRRAGEGREKKAATDDRREEKREL